MVDLIKSYPYRASDILRRMVKSVSQIGISCYNEYVPVFISNNTDNIYNGKIIEYSLKTPPYVSVVKGYSRLYDKLASSNISYYFKTAAMKEELIVQKGVLYTSDTGPRIRILFLVAVKTVEAKRFVLRKDVDPENFTIFLSEEFVVSPVYKTLYRKFTKDLILPHLERGVEIKIVKSIEKKCFNNNLKRPKFKTLSHLRQYLSDQNKFLDATRIEA